MRISYFAKTGKLQVTLLYLSGEKCPGKTVTLDEKDIALHPNVVGLLLQEWTNGD